MFKTKGALVYLSVCLSVISFRVSVSVCLSVVCFYVFSAGHCAASRIKTLAVNITFVGMLCAASWIDVASLAFNLNQVATFYWYF
jgi:hypothetical protein